MIFRVIVKILIVELKWPVIKVMSTFLRKKVIFQLIYLFLCADF